MRVEAELAGAAAAPRPARVDPRRLLRDRWPAILGFAALAVPTVVSLSEHAWGRETAAHGPLVLVTGLWLLVRELAAVRASARPGAPWVTWPALVASLAMYVLGRVFDFASVEAAGLLGAGIALLHDAVGPAVLARAWFPLVYLGFAVPPPGALIDRVTAPLKQFVSEAATRAVAGLGIPASREGVTISVAQTQLLVEDACSGMNSLIGLTAISLIYIYLLRGSSLRYSLLVALFVAPIAVAGNVVRVIVLVLLTYFFGSEVAQGFLHYTAGFLLFALDLLLVFAVDMALIRIAPRSWRPVR